MPSCPECLLERNYLGPQLAVDTRHPRRRGPGGIARLEGHVRMRAISADPLPSRSDLRTSRRFGRRSSRGRRCSARGDGPRSCNKSACPGTRLATPKGEPDENTPTALLQAGGLFETHLTVSDLDRSTAFY